MIARRKLAAVCAAAVIGGIATLGLAGPAAAAGRSYRTTIQNVGVHISEPEQWLNAGSAGWNYGPRARLRLESNGNLRVIDTRNNATKWESRTGGMGITQMKFQHDGNLVLYRANGSAPWATGTAFGQARGCDRAWGEQPVLALQDDSNVVVYCRYGEIIIGPGTPTGDVNYRAAWATNTRF
ncbi:MAG TPA: hypothetical protein VES42_20085 [Pilimelia sp.]|nr:hypothetical protein [Pilimelia sp.]